MLTRFLAFALFSLVLTASQAQVPDFTRQDTLFGSITSERAWWDLTYYHLDITVNTQDSSISGSNLIRYRVLEPNDRLQIELQAPMRIMSVSQHGTPLRVESRGNVHYVHLEAPQPTGSLQELAIAFGGRPRVAQNPPWDGGFVWSQDSQGEPFIANANQGIGSSVWWPSKDHPYDEVDSMLISVRVPAGLSDVSNGRLRGIDQHPDGDRTFHWFVANPINSYGVNVSVADYVHFSEVYAGERGPLDCDYYVLRENLAKAKIQFREVPRVLAAFEHWFGPYPFYEDGFKLVEVPYLGMEHQSAVTYGNNYQNGYRGTDLSQTGWGLAFDFIIVHESGHEWFANSLTDRDVADMWLHESFTAYAENLFLDFHFGTPAASAYVRGTRFRIQNEEPIQSPFRNVDRPGSGDMYYKGANMLHTLRQWIDDDDRWRALLRELQATFRHQTVTAAEVEAFLSQASGLNLSPFFDQYVRDVRIPTLEYRFFDDRLAYRWVNTVPDFAMPVRVYLDGQSHWLEATTNWRHQLGDFAQKRLQVDDDFYVGTRNITVEPK